MRGAYLVTSACLLALAALIAVEALGLHYYTPLGPGPGFFPFWLAVALGACATAMFLQALLRPSPPMPRDFWPDRAGVAKMGGVVLSLVATILLLEPLGYRLTMLGVIAFLLLVLGRRDLVVSPLVALAGSFGVYHVFVQWLKVPLPPGPFGP